MNLDRLLLDTHAFLWWRTNDSRLNESARSAIAQASLVFVSAASAWEAAIKSALGKLAIPEPMEAGVIDSGFVRLAIGFSHAEVAAALPAHHNDPFDRMLIAQAQIEKLVLVTNDLRIKPYDVQLLWT